jgi:CBS domain-containing protein
MHARMVSTSPDSPVAEAAGAMVREKVGSALVMQGSFLAGILTERDVLKAAASGSDLTVVPVSAWMTKDPQSTGPDTPVEKAAQIMLLNGFRHLPIVEGRRVHGVVSLRDLFSVEGRRVHGVVSLRDLFSARISRPSQPRSAAS